MPAQLIAKLAEQLVSAETSTSSHLAPPDDVPDALVQSPGLCSSTASGTKVDIVVRTLHRPP